MFEKQRFCAWCPNDIEPDAPYIKDARFLNPEWCSRECREMWLWHTPGGSLTTNPSVESNT